MGLGYFVKKIIIKACLETAIKKKQLGESLKNNEKNKIMNKVVVAIFDTESNALEGLSALKSLDEDSSINIYATAVVTKDADGKETVKKESTQGILRTSPGVLSGGLIGLLTGSERMVLGDGYGVMKESIYDFSKADVNLDFINRVMEVFTPGKVAVLADVEETCTTFIDTRLDKLGGLVFRSN